MNGEISSEKLKEDQERLERDSSAAVNFAHKNHRWLLLNIYFNAVLYSSCFWVQIGVLPVIWEASCLLHSCIRSFIMLTPLWRGLEIQMEEGLSRGNF